MRLIRLQLRNGRQIYAWRQQDVQQRKVSEAILDRLGERKNLERSYEPAVTGLAVRSILDCVSINRFFSQLLS